MEGQRHKYSRYYTEESSCSQKDRAEDSKL